MDLFEDTSDLVAAESQSTQLLQHVVRGGPGSALKRTIPSATSHNITDDSITSKEFSESTDSCSRSTAPKYHYHGLAATQTQTQYEEHVTLEGSQKENAQTSSDLQFRAGPPSQTRLPSPPVSSSKVSFVANAVNHTSSRLPNNVARTKALLPHVTSEMDLPLKSNPTTKGPSFQSPRGNSINMPHAKSLPGRSKPQRSPSEDSFIGGVFQDPEREFLATTKQFDVPLSELGRVSTQEEPTPLSHTSMPPYSHGGSSHYTNMPFNSPAHGKVLVEATPSNSGSSQGHIQDTQPFSQDPSSFQPLPMDAYNDAPLDDTVANSPLTQAYDSTPSSSYENLLNGDGISEVATQPTEELEATQPSESVELDLDVPPHQNSRIHNANWNSNIDATPIVSAPAASSATSTAARSLLAMVNPAKKWRIAALQQQSAERSAHRPLSPQETQPSDMNDDTTDVAVAGWGGNERKRGTGATYRLSPARHAMEIVPDSEPAMDQTPGQSTKGPTSLENSPTKNFLSIDPDRKLDLVTGHAREEHEEEEEEEEEVPLAAALVGRGQREPPRSKGKPVEKSVPMSGEKSNFASSKTKPGSKDATNAKARQKNTADLRSEADTDDTANRLTGTATTGQKVGRSWEIGEVPSSAPDQDVYQGKSRGAPPAVSNIPSRAALPNSKTGKLGRVSNRQSKPTSSAPSAAKRRRISSDTEEDDELDLLTQKESGVVSRPEEEEEEEEKETELADDEPMEIDTKPTINRSSGKRKRQESNVPKKASKTSTRARKASDSTPIPRLAKRLRSAVPGSRTASEPPTRVFALWKQDGHYYSGTVHSIAANSSTRYLIKFDDDTEDVVDTSKMRRCELNKGDNIILSAGNQKARVAEVASDVIGVEVDDGADLERLEVEVADIRIAGKTLMKQWDDRTVDVDSIVTIVKPKHLRDPSPSKFSVVSGSSMRSGRSKALCKAGFVVTLSVGRDNWEKEKERVVIMIKQNGGTVLDDWSEIFPMHGKSSNGNKRWTAHQSDVKWTTTEGIDRIFLLADDANQKPKFLIALALGIPCVSIDWLDAVVKQGKEDWQPYLLPAGFCDPLHARISQVVDLDWGNSIEYLNDIVSNQVASKLFKGKSVLCVSGHFVPLAKLKRQHFSDAEKAKESSRTIPRIILAMGAERVEAVSEGRHSSDPSYASFDYIVVKEAHDIIRGLPVGVTCVPFPWVKECLIASRCLPLMDR